MPYPRILGGRAGIEELDEAHMFPEWTDKACFVGFFSIALLTSTSAPVEQRALFVLFVFLAVVPSAVALFRPVEPLVFAAGTLAPLAVVNWAPASVGWYDFHGISQANLLMPTLLAGQLVATAKARHAVWVVVACTALPIGRWFVDDQMGSLPIWLGATVIGTVIGLIVRKLITSLADLKAAEGELRQKAASDERQRIAREVHDVIAHSMSVTMLHVTAARLAVGRGDAAAATEALEEAERLGRESLGEIRHTVGLLRTEADGGVETPQPTACDIVALVDDFVTAGVDVELRVDGDLAGVGNTVGLTAFRVVQESLANAVRHHPGSACVVDVHVDGDLRLRIRSAGGTRPPRGMVDPNGPGNGLRGMRERVEALRGTFSAGADRDGWTVECRLPEVVT